MECEDIDTALERQAQPLLKRQLVFIKAGCLKNLDQLKLKETPAVPSMPKPTELTSEDIIPSLLSAYSPSNTSLKNVGSGLVNMTNTCYLNSALQCLLHTPPLCSYLVKETHSKNCRVKNEQRFCALCSLENLTKNSRLKVRGENMRAVMPRDIVKNLKSVGKQFRSYRQEDSHEFMRCFVDALQLSAIGFNKKIPLAIQESSIVSRIFRGALKSKIVCNSCHKESTITESFMDLSLEINKSNTLFQSLENFFREEYLRGNNKYFCSYCKRLNDATKQFSIDSRISSCNSCSSRYIEFTLEEIQQIHGEDKEASRV
jgi:ubiquitin carboxyl-terminal hydrolase 36/42